MGQDRFENLCGVGSYDYDYYDDYIDGSLTPKYKRPVTPFKKGYRNYCYLARLLKVRHLRNKKIMGITEGSNVLNIFYNPTTKYLSIKKDDGAILYFIFTSYHEGEGCYAFDINIISYSKSGIIELLNKSVNSYQLLCDEIMKFKFNKYTK
jgi:hypothetical protein